MIACYRVRNSLFAHMCLTCYCVLSIISFMCPTTVKRTHFLLNDTDIMNLRLIIMCVL